MAANPDEKSAFDDLISVREAADILHVSESTVWRWIGRGILKAHRVGPKRVCLRREELEPALKPVETRGEMEGAEARERRLRRKEAVELRLERDRFPRALPEPRLSTEEFLERAGKLQQEILDRRGGVPLPPSWILINEAREERSELF